MYGEWSPLINFPHRSGCAGCRFLPITMNLLPSGRVLMWQDDNESGPRGSGTDTIAYLWDLDGNTITPVNNTSVDLFCAGHTFLPDGTLIVGGGHDGSDNNGTKTTY